MSPREAEEAFRAARYAQPKLAAVRLDPDVIGSGSVACVYRGVLPDGTTVAIKLKRPRIEDRMRCDLAILEGLVRLVQWLPKLRGMPIADLVAYVSAAILQQLDFDRELENTKQIQQALASMPDVVVPTIRQELCTKTCLVFEHIPELHTQTVSRLSDQARRRLGALALAAVHELFFVHGLVHCDLHPGNLYVTLDGRIVILDAGYCVYLPDPVRRMVGEFFACLAAGDGRRCGEIVLESAANVRSTPDRSGFVAEFNQLVAEMAGGASKFDMPSFGDSVYMLQKRFGVYAASDFAFPLMSLLVVYETVGLINSEIDFRLVGQTTSALAELTASGVDDVERAVHR